MFADWLVVDFGRRHSSSSSGSRMDDIGNMWQEKGIMSKLRTGPGRVAVLYMVGLLGCVIAGENRFFHL